MSNTHMHVAAHRVSHCGKGARVRQPSDSVSVSHRARVRDVAVTSAVTSVSSLPVVLRHLSLSSARALGFRQKKNVLTRAHALTLS